VYRGIFWSSLLAIASVAAITCVASCAPPPAPATVSQVAPSEAVVAASVTEADAAPDEPPEPPPLPSSCAERLEITKDDSACIPDQDFAKRLCAGSFPDVAIALNAKDSPWSRVWLAGDVEAWNASGARFTNPEKLLFDEEVLVLSRRAAPAGRAVVVSGVQATYDVMRWDGTCVSVQEGELRWKRPPAPKTALISWKNLEESTRAALLASKWVKAARDAADKACASTDDATKRLACKTAEREASQAVGNALRTGLSVPSTPARRP